MKVFDSPSGRWDDNEYLFAESSYSEDDDTVKWYGDKEELHCFEFELSKFCDDCDWGDFVLKLGRWEEQTFCDCFELEVWGEEGDLFEQFVIGEKGCDGTNPAGGTGVCNVADAGRLWGCREPCEGANPGVFVRLKVNFKHSGSETGGLEFGNFVETVF